MLLFFLRISDLLSAELYAASMRRVKVETPSGRHTSCFALDKFKVDKSLDTPFLLFLGEGCAFLQVGDSGVEPAVLVEHISLGVIVLLCNKRTIQNGFAKSNGVGKRTVERDCVIGVKYKVKRIHKSLVSLQHLWVRIDL